MIYLLLAYLSSAFAFSLSWPQKEEDLCSDGFGILAHFCGKYEGLVTKEVDRQERCSLLKKGDVFLKVLPSREVRVYTGKKMYHKVGKIPLNSSSLEVDISRRECAPLIGVTPKDPGCKRLNLEGYFSASGGKQSFTGDYRIFDEGTLNSCRYSFNVGKMN